MIETLTAAEFMVADAQHQGWLQAAYALQIHMLRKQVRKGGKTERVFVDGDTTYKVRTINGIWCELNGERFPYLATEQTPPQVFYAWRATPTLPEVLVVFQGLLRHAGKTHAGASRSSLKNGNGFLLVEENRLLTIAFDAREVPARCFDIHILREPYVAQVPIHFPGTRLVAHAPCAAYAVHQTFTLEAP